MNKTTWTFFIGFLIASGLALATPELIRYGYENNGTPLTPRPILNMTGSVACSDSPGTNSTDCAFSGAAGPTGPTGAAGATGPTGATGATGPTGGGVTSVSAASPLASSGGTSPEISLASAVGVDKGGTGLTATPTNGQLPIGNGTGYSLSTLTAGTNISISNGFGSITINGSTVTLAQEYFVAKNGNDSTGNGSLSAPYLTIGAALTAANSVVDTSYVRINVAPGTYTEDVSITRRRTFLVGSGTGFQPRTTTIVGAVTINPTSTSDRYGDIVGLANALFTASGSATAPTVTVTGNQLFTVIVQDAYVNVDASGQYGFLLDNSAASRTILSFQDSRVARSGATGTVDLCRFTHGDIRMSSTVVDSGNATGAGSAIYLGNDATLIADRLQVDSYMTGPRINATGGYAGTKLTLANSSVGSRATSAASPALYCSNTGGTACVLWNTIISMQDTAAGRYAIDGAMTLPYLTLGYSLVSFVPATTGITNSSVNPAFALTTLQFAMLGGTPTNAYWYDGGAGYIFANETIKNPSGDAGLSFDAVSGFNAIQVKTAGARIDFGPNADDYMASDGGAGILTNGSFGSTSAFTSAAGLTAYKVGAFGGAASAFTAAAATASQSGTLAYNSTDKTFYQQRLGLDAGTSTWSPLAQPNLVYDAQTISTRVVLSADAHMPTIAEVLHMNSAKDHLEYTCTTGVQTMARQGGVWGKTYYPMATTAVSGNQQSCYTNDSTGGAFRAFTTLTNLPASCQRVYTGTVTSVRYWTGVATAVPAAGSSTMGVEGIAFRFDTSVPDTNWQLCATNTGLTTSCASTTVAVAANSEYLLCYTVDTAYNLYAYINGVYAGTLTAATSGLSSASTALLGHFISAEALSASARTLNVGVMQVQTQ